MIRETRASRASVELPSFDLHRVEESLRTNHRLFHGKSMTDGEIVVAVHDYRMFLRDHLARGCPEEFEVPSLIVDRVWHTHMCETKQYAEDCQSYFGKMLHHSNRTCDMKPKITGTFPVVEVADQPRA